MIRQIDDMHLRGTRSRSRTDASWRAEIFIFAAIIFLFSAGVSQPALADSWDLGVRLDGEWEEKCPGGGTSVFRAKQGESKVTFRYVNPCGRSQKYGFRKNHVSIRGKIQTRKVKGVLKHTITGKIKTRVPPKLSKICPELSVFVAVRGEITADLEFSKIKFTYQHSEIHFTKTDKICRVVRKGPTVFEMSRRILVESIRISQTVPRIQTGPRRQGPATIQLVSRTRRQVPYAKFTVRVKFSKNAAPVLDAYPVDIYIASKIGTRRKAMARRARSSLGNVYYRIPSIKLVNK